MSGSSLAGTPLQVRGRAGPHRRGASHAVVITTVRGRPAQRPTTPSDSLAARERSKPATACQRRTASPRASTRAATPIALENSGQRVDGDRDAEEDTDGPRHLIGGAAGPRGDDELVPRAEIHLVERAPVGDRLPQDVAFPQSLSRALDAQVGDLRVRRRAPRAVRDAPAVAPAHDG